MGTDFKSVPYRNVAGRELQYRSVAELEIE